MGLPIKDSFLETAVSLGYTEFEAFRMWYQKYSTFDVTFLIIERLESVDIDPDPELVSKFFFFCSIEKNGEIVFAEELLDSEILIYAREPEEGNFIEMRKNKYRKPDYQHKFKDHLEFAKFCETIRDHPDNFLQNEIFSQLETPNDFLAFATCFDPKPLKEKIHKFKDVSFIFDKYYFGMKIPDIDYYYLLTHTDSLNFIEKILLSFEEQEFANEKAIYLALTVFITDQKTRKLLSIPEETIKFIKEEKPKVKVENFFMNGRRREINDNENLRNILMKRIKEIGEECVENFKEIGAVEKFSFTDVEMRIIMFNESLEL